MVTSRGQAPPLRAVASPSLALLSEPSVTAVCGLYQYCTWWLYLAYNHSASLSRPLDIKPLVDSMSWATLQGAFVVTFLVLRGREES